MYNLYQSQLRKDIQGTIYRNPICTVDLFGKKYFGTIKTKKFGPITTQRYQIMGVELPDDVTYVQKELAALKKKFRGKGIFFQLGIINEIVSFENSMKRCQEFDEDMKYFRLGMQSALNTRYGLKTAFRENMPTAGIVYDVTKSDDELFKEMNESCKKRIKKAIAGGMQYRILDKKNYEEFFAKRQKTADAKGFNTISKVQYTGLLTYIEQGKGMLIGAYINDEMIAGTICLFTDTLIYCPYGFFDRKYSNIGVQHFLKFKLFSRARDHGFVSVDTGGGAPTGFPKHSLASVSTFKESLGGTKIEQYGSYDIVLNSWLYLAFKLYYKLRG